MCAQKLFVGFGSDRASWLAVPESTRKAVIGFIDRCHGLWLDAGEAGLSSEMKDRIRWEGAGRKQALPELDDAVWAWFSNFRIGRKMRVKLGFFKKQVRMIVKKIAQKKGGHGEQVCIDNDWCARWCRLYGVSLKKPNKRFGLSKAKKATRLKNYLTNVYMVRGYLELKKKHKPTVFVSGDQTPTRMSESADSQTLDMKNAADGTAVAENYMLSRARNSVMTTCSSHGSVNLWPEMLFHGTPEEERSARGKRIKVQVPEIKVDGQLISADHFHVRLSNSGSYTPEALLEYARRFPQRTNPHNVEDYGIVSLDDYNAHLQPELFAVFLAKGWILIIMDGGLTSIDQVNDTDCHEHLHAAHRDVETEYLNAERVKDPHVMPKMDRDVAFDIITRAWVRCGFNMGFAAAFKKRFLTNELDGSEDHLVASELAIGFPEIFTWRDEAVEVGRRCKNMKEVLASDFQVLVLVLYSNYKSSPPPDSLRAFEILEFVTPPPWRAFEILEFVTPPPLRAFEILEFVIHPNFAREILEFVTPPPLRAFEILEFVTPPPLRAFEILEFVTPPPLGAKSWNV